MANIYGEEVYNKALLEVKAALTGHQPGQASEFLPVATAEEIINLVYDRNWARQAFQSINLRRETLNIALERNVVDFATTDFKSGVEKADPYAICNMERALDFSTLSG